MGYDGVEFASLFGFSPEYVKGLLDGIGLIPVYAHVPLDEMLDASVKSGASWVVVEQDEPSMNLSRIECVKASLEYLKSIEW